MSTRLCFLAALLSSALARILFSFVLFLFFFLVARRLTHPTQVGAHEMIVKMPASVLPTHIRGNCSAPTQVPKPYLIKTTPGISEERDGVEVELYMCVCGRNNCWIETMLESEGEGLTYMHEPIFKVPHSRLLSHNVSL